MTTTFLSHSDVANLGADLKEMVETYGPKVWPVPRGGIPAVYALCRLFPHLEIVDTLEEATFVFDDIIDTGRTMERICDQKPGVPFFALIDKTDPACPFKESWIVFPWESQHNSGDDSIVGTLYNRLMEEGHPFFANDCIASVFRKGERKQYKKEIERRVQYLLDGLLIDTESDHNTKDTAKRMSRMYIDEVFKGRYHHPPTITSFPNFRELDEMYVTGPITIRSACSHHLVPIIGECYIGIVPSDYVIGLSKFNRIVDWIASRPQIQEELVVQIADYIEDEMNPEGLAVVIKASHLCMTWRGVKEQPTASMITSVQRGVMRDNEAARLEFMSLVK